MTKQDISNLKAEIVAELVQHLDEHYVSKAEMKTTAVTLTKIVSEPLGKLVSNLHGRVYEVELAVALTHAHKGIDPTDS